MRLSVPGIKKRKKKLRGILKIKNSSLCSQQMDPLHLHCSNLASCPLSRHAPNSLGGQGRSPVFLRCRAVLPGRFTRVSVLRACKYRQITGASVSWLSPPPRVGSSERLAVQEEDLSVASSRPYTIKAHYKPRRRHLLVSTAMWWACKHNLKC